MTLHNTKKKYTFVDCGYFCGTNWTKTCKLIEGKKKKRDNENTYRSDKSSFDTQSTTRKTDLSLITQATYRMGRHRVLFSLISAEPAVLYKSLPL